MAARKIKSSWWTDFQINKIRYRKRSPENTKMGAQAYESILRQKLARGESLDEILSPKETIIFQAFASEWFETSVKADNKPSGIKTKQTILENHLYPFFGRLPLEKITPQLIDQFKALKLQQSFSPKTINNFLAVLLRCLRVAADWERLDKVPRVKKLKGVSQRLEFLSPTESRLLVQRCPEPMWKEMLLVALRTGMRLGELFGLEWQDIDFQRKMVTVSRSIVHGIIGTPKSGKVRYIPITEEVCKVLYERRRKDGLVFHRGEGQPLSHHIAANAMQRSCRAAGIRHTTWHVLRHTFASQLVSEGVPINAVQTLMGHSTIVMTMRYAHLAPTALRSAVEVLERAEKRENPTECQPGVNLKELLTEVAP